MAGENIYLPGDQLEVTATHLGSCCSALLSSQTRRQGDKTHCFPTSLNFTRPTSRRLSASAQPSTSGLREVPCQPDLAAGRLLQVTHSHSSVTHGSGNARTRARARVRQGRRAASDKGRIVPSTAGNKPLDNPEIKSYLGEKRLLSLTSRRQQQTPWNFFKGRRSRYS